MRKERVIWDSEIRLEDWKDFLKEEHPEVTDEYEQYVLCAELNDEYLDDERMNLDIELDNQILCIADLGFWNGRRSAYKIIHSGNIKDILSSETEIAKWYSDGYNVKCRATHHDGTNYYEYREIRKGKDIEKLLDKLYHGEPVSRKTLNYYTKSILPHVAKVYGW